MLSLWLGVLWLLSCEKDQEMKQPNILFIMSDDHASHAISAYGGIYQELLPTPNIDRLAEEGIRLDQVFCTNAICGPSRASILTGTYSHLNGYVKNHQGGKFDSTQWTFPRAFQENGYQTALVGKWHLGTEPVGFDYFKYHNNRGQQGTYYDPLYNENGTNTVETGYATTLTTDFALTWLEEQCDPGSPFMMMLQFKAPHRKWIRDTTLGDLFEGIEMPYPTTFWDDYQGREQTAGDTEMTMDYLDPRDMKLTPPDSITDPALLKRWMEMGYKRGTGEGWLPHDSMTVQEARQWKYQRYIKDYLACVHAVDDNIGRVLQYLDDHGLSDNTIVIYTSDQGFFLGDHGFFDKRFMYEPSLRMPFLIRYPQRLRPGLVRNDIIMNIDFAPTLLDLAGIPIPEQVQGESFTSVLLNEEPDWRKAMYYHYYEYPFWHHVQPHYGIRTDRYKLIHFYHDVDQWECYDLAEDPNELHNLIHSPAHESTIEQLRNELYQIQAFYEDDVGLDSMRSITNTNFGRIGGGH